MVFATELTNQPWVCSPSWWFYGIQNNVPHFEANVTFSKTMIMIGIRGIPLFSFITPWIEQKELDLSFPLCPFCFPLYEREAEDPDWEMASSGAWSHISIKYITWINSIKLTSKRDTREKWGYWSEVLNKRTSPRSDVLRCAECSRGIKVQLPQRRAGYLSCADVQSFLKVRKSRKYIKAKNHISNLHNALDLLYMTSF